MSLTPLKEALSVFWLIINGMKTQICMKKICRVLFILGTTDHKVLVPIKFLISMASKTRKYE